LQFWVGYEWFGQDTTAVSVSDPGNLSDAKTIIVPTVTRPAILDLRIFPEPAGQQLVASLFTLLSRWLTYLS
jgi:hypothetical protein